MNLRSWLYFKDLFSSIKPNAHVISVGNLVMGGSGKTPVVIYLAKLLLKNGFRTAAISRGYRGKASCASNTVSNGVEILMNAEEAGDEPRLIAETVPGLVVLTGKKRKHPCSHATQIHSCDTIILDDGFQHLGIKRDLDLVLFSAATLFENMSVFPAGYLREPFSALQRADCFIITGCNQSNLSTVKKFESDLFESFPDKPIFRNHYVAKHLVDIKNNIYDLTHITEPVIAFSGIASPLRFKNSLQENSIDLVDFITFKDHHEYSSFTFKRLQNVADSTGCKTFITTSKDMVKLKNITTDLKIFALQMSVEFDQSFDSYILGNYSGGDTKPEKPRTVTVQ